MLVFIDESGDPGFKLDEGSTPIFALSMVIFREAEESRRTQHLIESLRSELRVQPEFKFSKCRDDYRDAFFDCVSGCGFSVRAIVARKALIRSRRLQTIGGEFLRFFIKSMMRFDDGVLAQAKVVIDGSGDRQFKRDLRAYLQTHAGPEAIRSIGLKNSRSDPLLQLADMCAGAIARSYRDDRTDANRWRAMLQPKIEDIWEFK